MPFNEFVKTERAERDKIFEILVVIIIVALIVFFAVRFYAEPIERSQHSIIEFHAGIFSRMTATIHAMGNASSGKYVTLSGVTFYLNEHGWPASTDKTRSALSVNQTAEECQQLWQAVFQSPPSSRVMSDVNNKRADYIISFEKKRFCRYELARKKEGSYYFEYDVANGTVSVTLAGGA